MYFLISGGQPEGQAPQNLFLSAGLNLKNGSFYVKQIFLTNPYILYQNYVAPTTYCILIMFLIITGNGKGKTTSAIGTAIRGLGWGKKVALVNFDKGGSHYGEQHILEKLQGIDVFRFGKKRFDEKSKKFRFKNTEDDKKEAKLAIQKIHDLYKMTKRRNDEMTKQQGYFLIIADELINCLNLGLADEPSIRELIDKCPSDTHLILTGRNAPEWMIEKADLVSEIQEVKHYFKSEGQAIKGLDY